MLDIFIVFWFLIGAAVGSFLNVVIHRLERHESFVRGRSHCPRCRHVLAWYDLLPVISFFALGRRCRYCRAKISWQYPLVEVATGLLFALGPGLVQGFWPALTYFIAVAFFMVLWVFDATSYLVPDRVSLPAIAIIFVLNFLSGVKMSSLLLGAVLGGLWFLLQFAISRGRWVGGGDVRLGILIGVLLGYPLVFIGLALAYLGGSLIAAVLLLLGRKRFGSRLPFATMLLPAALAAWLWGSNIWQWYFTALGF
ncbi:MAG: hypothetical protein A3H70_02500 [Candidatus Komeilibacteria bacterium RIFCSPLOWO2_02_FULL_48_11]|uniref:Prepilin peptidase n=1 Tax=Candidatus Komeilibacteria bacterium RIFCSPLOWO2_02_FULL_48_11 TaxID=1798553 RepID=A0A1G2BPZ7_9BACT|nr:MAG: hypothetical protein A3H70_02500 [Candidatus Komeilibacteria bacterium RIFCSPLOWO2_02_FULL_48_11]